MTAPAAVYPLAPAVLPLQAATQRLWMIRRLLRERAIDSHAALTSLGVLAAHPNPRVAALAIETSSDLADLFVEADAGGIAQ